MLLSTPLFASQSSHALLTANLLQSLSKNFASANITMAIMALCAWPPAPNQLNATNHFKYTCKYICSGPAVDEVTIEGPRQHTRLSCMLPWAWALERTLSRCLPP